MNEPCRLCPRNCGVNRSSEIGFCGQNDRITVARAALHYWEEPCISGTRGSGTVFFCGCNLKCVYCQNAEISCDKSGKVVTADKLGEIFLHLQSQGAHNINLVTPTHYIPQITTALDLVEEKLDIPTVYNTGGYESKYGLSLLDRKINIYLTDVKYADSNIAMRYSRAADYPEVSIKALAEMLRQTGRPVFDKDGMLKSGVIVRHLVLPSYRKDSMKVLDRLKAEFGTDEFILSLMSQYTPNGRLAKYPEINRRITSFEYNSVTDYALDLGFSSAYTQLRSSAKEEYTPPFDLTGV